MQVPKLVTPLRCNSKRVLVECDDDQETGDGREVGSEGLRVDLDGILDLLCDDPDLLEWVVWICGSEARRRARVGEAVWVGVVARSDWAADVDAGGH